MNMGAQIGGACTTSLIPLIAARFGWQMSFFVAALIAVLGALAWLIVDPKRSLVTPQTSDLSHVRNLALPIQTSIKLK
jgi:ACS family glucarate transporter-like MFS transporter